jgi:hypothetical protein
MARVTIVKPFFRSFRDELDIMIPATEVVRGMVSLKEFRGSNRHTLLDHVARPITCVW